jgi:sporulation protein YabP
LEDRNNLKSDTRKMRGDKTHCITIDNRNKMSISGVIYVDSFNELEIVLETELGMLTIKGASMHMNKLNLESGDLLIDGNIDSCIYSEKQDIKTKGAGILSKLFK